MIVVLPALGGETISPRWPLPIGESRSTIRGVRSVLPSFSLEVELLVGEERRQVLEAGPQAGDLGIETRDAVDAQQRGVLLVRGRRAEAAHDHVALAQVVTANLVDRDVDVVGRRVVALRAQEAVAVVAQVQQAFDLESSEPLRLRRLRRFRPPCSLVNSRGCALRDWLFWRSRGCDWRSAPLSFVVGSPVTVVSFEGDDSTLVADVATVAASAPLAWALISEANSLTSSSKSSAGVATVRLDRTTREGDSVATAVVTGLGETSPMMASMREALLARAVTSTPFTLAMVWRSSRVLDSRSDLSGEGFSAINVPFSPLA
jgi:hypothetical protein